MWNRKNSIKDLGELSKYENIYEWKDIVLYNSYCLLDEDEEERQKGIMSNFYSPCNIVYKGKTFCSSEQLYFYRIITEWGSYLEDSKSVSEELLKCTDGRQVKNNKQVKALSDKIEKKMIKDLGKEKYMLMDWKLMYDCLCYKYRYCKEFRDVLEKFKDKTIVEDCIWGDNWAGGVWDKKIGKYRGANVVGKAIMLVYKNRNTIMGEN